MSVQYPKIIPESSESESESDQDDNQTFNENDIPDDIRQQADALSKNLLPEKSKELYIQKYNEFIAWMKSRKINSMSEDVLMVYFNHLVVDTNIAPSTAWTRWSMIKSTLQQYHNVDIGNYNKLKAFVERYQKGYKPKKSEIFTAEDMKNFCEKADDRQHLADKMMHQQTIFFKLSKKKRCTKQRIGINKIGGAPKRIAEFLKLPSANKFTRHCFRRTGATNLADTGANMTEIKLFDGWKSDKVAEGYLVDSRSNKRKIFNNMSNFVFNNESAKKPKIVRPLVERQMNINTGASTSKASTLSRVQHININPGINPSTSSPKILASSAVQYNKQSKKPISRLSAGFASMFTLSNCSVHIHVAESTLDKNQEERDAEEIEAVEHIEFEDEDFD
ncbi:hypothetical protein HCN44_001336 [Aphidius gifuensis]|uniref:Integrase SAM-like N-terminal domain-containing protein n=1 Tax=Aphidius gifuensis TaxID=684658 RepID=A0A834XHP2_APHGI|nr:hypothetical protein HCN44_001336 [Aphidius gifuensis]